MQAAPRKLLTSMRPTIAVRDPLKPLNLQSSSRALPVPDIPKTAFTPMAPRKTAGRKRRGRKGGKGRKTRRHRK